MCTSGDDSKSNDNENETRSDIHSDTNSGSSFELHTMLDEFTMEGLNLKDTQPVF